MDPEQLTDRMQKLKKSLDDIQERVTETQLPREVLEDFKSAVDHTRMTVWGILCTPDTNLNELMARFRIKHTMDMCNRILVDVVSGVATDRNQLQKFRATLEDTLDRLKAAS